MIRLLRLTLRRAPGLPDGVELRGLGPGLNLVLGPNASGKSTMARVLLACLGPGEHLDDVHAELHWDTDRGPVEAVAAAGNFRWEPARPPLPPGDAVPLLALDLRSLLEGGEAEELFSRRLGVELMAGYDLEAAMAALVPPSPRKGELQAALDRARTALRALERKAEELAREEEGLAELRERLEEARAAEAEQGLAERIAGLRGLEERVRELEERLADLPPGLEALTGREAEELQKLRQQREGAAEALEEAERRLDEIRRAAAELELPDPPPARADLDGWTRRVREMEERSRRLEDLRRELEGARAAAREARSRLGSWEDEAGAGPPSEGLAELESLLARRQQLRAEQEEARAALDRWEAEAAAESSPPAEPLERGIDALRSWLRSAPVERIPVWPGWAALAAGAAGLAAAWVPAPQLTWLPALLAGAGAGHLAALALARRRAGGSPLREAERRAREAGVEPARWEEAAVLEALRAAEARRAGLAAAEHAARRAEEARRTLEDRHTRLEDVEVRIRQLAGRLGLDPELPDLALLETARRVEGWVAARLEAVRLEAETRQLEEALRRELDELGTWFVSLGRPQPATPAAAAAALGELGLALERRRSLEEQAREVEAGRDQADRRLADLSEELEAFWAHAGVPEGDEAELARRLEALPRYRELREALIEARAVAERERRALDEADSWELLDLDPVSCTAEQARAVAERLAETAREREALVREITRIESEIRRAGEGHALEDARADVERAALALAEHRDRAMVTALARTLLEHARDLQRREHAPAVLRRARDRFAAFTQGAFTLEVGADGSLAARDSATGKRRTLEELSDGTRIHLLLAARLAALEEAEAGLGPLPIVLDEALSTTDPHRFGSIAGALLELAREGRQLLYLTADPSEAAQWREACREAGLEPPDPLRPTVPGDTVEAWPREALRAAPPPEIPDPAGMDAAAWARALGVPAPDPWRPWGAWHPVHLAPDRLPLVHRVLRMGFATAGALHEALEGGGLASALSPPERAFLGARAALFAGALEGWREGRGRPVTWRDVAASGTVSSTFAEQVRGLVERLGRDPLAFLEAVRSLPKFRSAKAAELEEFLREAGVLPTGDPPGTDTVVARALDLSHPAWTEAGMEAAEAAAYVRTVLGWLEDPGSLRGE